MMTKEDVSIVFTDSSETILINYFV